MKNEEGRGRMNVYLIYLEVRKRIKVQFLSFSILVIELEIFLEIPRHVTERCRDHLDKFLKNFNYY